MWQKRAVVAIEIVHREILQYDNDKHLLHRGNSNTSLRNENETPMQLLKNKEKETLL